MKIKYSYLSFVCLGMSFAFTAEAQAQQTEAEDTLLEDVIYADGHLDIPRALSNFSDKDLEQAGVVSTQDLRQIEPSLVFTTNSVFGQPYLRGVGSDLFSPGAEASIGTYVDGVYQARSVSAVQDFFDVNEVEVLKGPQGAKFGRNAVGGSILIRTQKPSDENEGMVELSYGNFNNVRFEGFSNVPVAPNAALRVSGLAHKRDGYTDNINTGGDVDSADLYALRAQLLLEPSDDLGLLLRANYSTEDSTRNLAARVNPKGGPAIADSFGAIRPDDIFQLATNDDGELRLDNYGFSATATYDFGKAKLESISAYNDTDMRQSVDLDASQLDFASNSGFQTSKTFTQELHLSSDMGGALKWQIGGFYLSEEASQQINNRFTFPVLVPNSLEQIGGDVKTRSIGVFGNVDYKLADKWTLEAGLRYSKDKRELDFEKTTTLFDPFPLGPEGPEGDPLVLPETNSDEASFDAVTPSFTVEYRADNDSLIYGTISKGYKAGGFNTNVNQSAFKPESLWAYELGYKASLWDDRAQFKAAAFAYDYNDLQLLSVPPGSAVGTFQKVINAAEATITGVEADFKIRPIEALQLNVAAALLDARYDDFIATNPNFPTILDVDRSGETLPRAPEFSFNVGALYQTQLLDRELDLSSNLRYEGFQYLDAFQDELVSRDENISLNGKMEYHFSEDASLSLWGRNITNEETVGSALRVDGLFGVIEFYMPPRNYGATINLKY